MAEDKATTTTAAEVPAGSQPDKGAAAPESSQPGATKDGQVGGQPDKGTTAPVEYEVKVNGQTRKVKLDDLIAGYSKGEDYTSKTQKLSQKEKELAERLRQIQDKERQILESQRQEISGAEEVDPIQALHQRQQALEQKIADDKLDKTLHDLKTKFPLLNEKLFLIEAYESRTEKFEELEALAQAHQQAREAEQSGIFEKIAGDAKHPLSEKWRQAIVNEYLAVKAAEGKPKGEHGGGGAPAGVSKKEPPKSFEEAGERALAKLQALP